MKSQDFDTIRTALNDGQLVPCLGPGVLGEARHTESRKPLPTGHAELAQALNGGRPLGPKLVHEFSRAAMHVEQRRGRRAVTRFLDQLYGSPAWSVPGWHRFIAALDLPYVVDFNRDRFLLDLYTDREHLLIQGVARIGGGEHRFHLYHFDGNRYTQRTATDDPDPTLPILFKPLGCPLPKGHYIASDADFVDYLTELMGGFGIPAFVKQRRRGLRYLLLGMALDRDTERMLIDGFVQDSAQPTGWALLPEATPKASRFLLRQNIERIDCTLSDWLSGVAEEWVQPHVAPQSTARIQGHPGLS